MFRWKKKVENKPSKNQELLTKHLYLKMLGYKPIRKIGERNNIINNYFDMEWCNRTFEYKGKKFIHTFSDSMIDHLTIDEIIKEDYTFETLYEWQTNNE